jgi:hypothetical protein
VTDWRLQNRGSNSLTLLVLVMSPLLKVLLSSANTGRKLPALSLTRLSSYPEAAIACDEWNMQFKTRFTLL